MPEERNHRSVILASIRLSLGAAQPAVSIGAEYAAISRTYAQSSTLSHRALLELFTDRLLEYDAGVYHRTAEAIPATIAEVLTSRGKQGLAIPTGLPSKWLPTDFTFTEADLLDVYQIDKTEGILTACTVAIAETGSIVLQNAVAQGPRILSLVPDYHLCVVFADQVVATVPEAFARLESTSTLPTTFISGPSATADIEMTRIKGVHGPRFFDVILVEGTAAKV
jgi:L-lactate dehydrogenase complex protein LldG